MKILFLSTWFPYPLDTGSRIRVHHLLRALGRSHQVTLVAMHSAEGSKDRSFSILESDHIEIYPVPIDAYRYVSAPQVLKFASPIPVAFWPSRLMRQTVAKVAGLGQWDAVVAFQSPAALYAPQLPGVPRILDVDTSLSYQMYERHISHDRPVAQLRTWVSWQKAHQYETRLFRSFQLCTVVSPAEVDYITGMVSTSSGHVEIVPNGVDCQYNRLGLVQPVPNTLVFNGTLTYSANYDAMQYFLAEIYPLLQQQEPDVSLTITGSTSGVDLVGLRLDEGVHLSGYVDDVRPLVAGARVCVVPLRQGGGTRLKILEAMALGTPVVATSKGAEGLDIVDGEHILLADDSVEFADRTLQLLRDPVLRQRLATNARRLVEQHYDWAPISQRFVDLVEDVVEGRGLA